MKTLKTETDMFFARLESAIEKEKRDTVEQHNAAQSFSEWLDQRKDALADPVSFEEWLSQSEDSI